MKTSAAIIWLNEIATPGAAAQVHLFTRPADDDDALRALGLALDGHLRVHRLVDHPDQLAEAVTIAAEVVRRTTLLHGHPPAGIVWISPSLTRTWSTTIRRRFGEVMTFLHTTQLSGLSEREVEGLRDLVAQLGRLG